MRTTLVRLQTHMEQVH